MAYAIAAARKSLWQGEILPVTVMGHRVLLVEVDGDVRAYADACPHLGVPLSTGRFDGKKLACRIHEWTFDMATGAGIIPQAACLQNYPVRIENDWIYVDLATAKKNDSGLCPTR